jgi:hypothetical protein
MACPSRPRNGLPGRKPYRPDCRNPTKVDKRFPVSIGHFMPGVGSGESKNLTVRNAPGSPTARFSGYLRSREWAGEITVARGRRWNPKFQNVCSIGSAKADGVGLRVTGGHRSLQTPLPATMQESRPHHGRKNARRSWESSGTYDKQTLVTATESQAKLGLTRLTLLSYTPCV